MQKLTKQAAFLRLSSLCSRQEKCTADIQKKTRQWGLSATDTEEVVQQLREEGYINDERYARAFARDKFRFNKWGRIRIEYELRMRRIPTGVIQQALAEIDETGYTEMIKSEITKKQESLKKETGIQKKAKIIRFAEQRGYEQDLIREILEK